MSSKLKKELELEITTIWDILQHAKECFHYSFYLYKPETIQERDYLNQSRDFSFIRHVLWRNTIIELSKLFSKSKDRDKFNIFHFINKLRKDGNFKQLKFSEELINGWEKQIEENEETIDQVLKLRDKVYGHTDRNIEDVKKTDITFEQTEKLILIVERVITDIFLEIFDAGAEMETVIFDKQRFDIVKILAKEREEYIKKLIDDAKKYGR